MILRNIDNFMTPFLRMIYDGISLTFSTMESFEFGNTNMLQVMIVIMILGVAIPLVLTISTNIANTSVVRGYKEGVKSETEFNRFIERHRKKK